MLFRKFSKTLSSKMIVRLHNLFLYPAVIARDPTLFHIPLLHRFSRIHFFHRFELPFNNPELFMPKSAAQPSVALSIDGIPRLAKSDAQAALFDYLHCTRGLSFLDAEHISKNSPRFLGDLIAKVEKEQDVSRALSRFFRYHPINEFEPFFESLGLSPTEFQSLLPRGLIFLNDDQVLLDNYHTLSDYGIPRSKIGRMYKEVNEIFRYEFGVLDCKLRAYEHLGLSRSTVIKLVTCCPLLLAGEVNNAFIRVLHKLKEMGFDSNWIGSYLSSKKTYHWNRVLDTLCFLREIGYSDAQMGDLFRKDTALLFDGSGKQVYVVVGALLKLGLKMNEVYALVLKNPQILSPKCSKNFWKALHFLFEIEMEPDNIGQILSIHLKFLGSHSLKGPKTVLRNFNGDKHSLCESIKNDPSTFFNLAFKSNICNAEYVAARNPSNFVEKTEFLLRIGYVENSEEMTKALKRFRGRGDQLQERFDCLVRAGLDFNAVSSMVKQAPTALNQTKDILEKKIDCLRNYLGYPVDSIVAFPSYLCYDMERISRRFSMYAWLREKGAAKPMLSVSTLVACSDTRFVKYFVDIHPEGPAVWEKLKKALPSS
ncbi:transcription termination factor MTEF18, mitochondrial [Sesamum indicum]|uniref:Transcription termination factor MTEF18, mitochondrial n=1 Tax=Sesamum indicum TaxID=4182 RepID=A0A8M8V4U8_SESIN|nr:transcription termination factor MTEF18, mitochondrial [Sesamum indicum]